MSSADSVRRTILENGLTVLTEHIDHIRSISLGIWLKKGSRDETVREAGIYHFIEHMLFKGTADRSAYDIARIMDSIGGYTDAFTSKENTCFYAKILDEHLPIILELFSDILIHPKFDKEDIEKERKVVHEEIKMVEDTPNDLVHELFLENFWSRHPLGRPILGTRHTVDGISQSLLRRHFAHNYVPENMLISAAGNVDHHRLVSEIRRHFPLQGGKAKRVATKPAAVRPRPMVLLKSKKDLEQAHVCIGMRGLPVDHPDRYSFSVLNVILGGSMSSRLFQKLREERGLCYTVFSSMSSFHDAGYVSIYAGTAKDTVESVIRLIVDECRLLASQPVGAEELENAKNHLKGSLILSLESSSNRMFNLVRNDVYHRRQISTDEILREVSAVTTEDIQRVAGDLFHHSEYGIVVVGALKKLGLTLDDFAVA
jgi:predicted Zn-dependent peptidase